MRKLNALIALAVILSVLFVVKPAAADFGENVQVIWQSSNADYKAKVYCSTMFDLVYLNATIYSFNSVPVDVTLPGYDGGDGGSSLGEPGYSWMYKYGVSYVTGYVTIKFDGNIIYSGFVSCGDVPVPPPGMIADGRINAYDIAAPVAIYGASAPAIYVIDANGNGSKLFDVSAEEIAAVGIPVYAPVVIAEAVNPVTGAMVTLYRLPSGEFQLNTFDAEGNLYEFIW